MGKKIFFLFMAFFLLVNLSSFATEQNNALWEGDKAQAFSLMPQKEGENASKEPFDEELLAPMIEEEEPDDANEVFETEEFSQR